MRIPTGTSEFPRFILSRPDEFRKPCLEWSLGLLPGFLIHDRGDFEQLADAIAAHPANVGLMIDPAAAVVIRGKNIRVIGDGTVTVGLAKGAGEEEICLYQRS